MEVTTAEKFRAMDSTDIRILIADDHALFRVAIRKLLQAEDGMRVVGEASNTSETIQQVNMLRPHIVLLDLCIPPDSSLEALRRVGTCSTDTRAILFTAALERKQTIKAVLLGARGVVNKNTSTLLFVKSIRSVMAGELWITRKLISDLVSAVQGAGLALEKSRAESFGLTQREIEIALAVADGCTNKDIAEKLSLSEQTVKNCLTRIFTKLGVSNRQELAVFAIHKILSA